MEFELSKQKELGLSSREVKKLESDLEKARNKLVQLNSQKRKFEEEENGKFDLDLKNIGKSMTEIITKVGKLALTIFGIRSAYNMIRNAMSTLSQYNEQMATDIEYFQYVLAKLLEPIINRIINLVYTLMAYVNYLAQAWFGIQGSIFASSKSFENAKKSMSGMNKESEKMNKSLSSLDEITNLDDGSKGGGNGGFTAPSIDLGNLDDVEIPSWLKWLGENGELIKNIIIGIGIALLTWKIVDILKNSELFNKVLGLLFGNIQKLGARLSNLQLAGIALIILGIILLIKDVINFLKNPTWENFGKIITDIGIILLGLSTIIGGIPLAIAAVIAIIVGLVITNKDKIMSIVRSLWQGIKDTFNGLPGWGQSLIKGFVNFIISGLNGLISALNTFLIPFRAAIVVIGKALGKNLSMSSVSFPRIPRMARGGVVNNPGRGVNIGGAIAGESGAEAVIPLQNSQYADAFAQQIADKVDGGLTVDLLLELNRNILELANRPVELNINGKKFAQATYGSYQQESNRINSSTAIKIS